MCFDVVLAESVYGLYDVIHNNGSKSGSFDDLSGSSSDVTDERCRMVSH